MSVCWTIIDGVKYDLTDFIHNHPGGEIIQAAIGIDASEMFARHHLHGYDEAYKQLQSLPRIEDKESHENNHSLLYDQWRDYLCIHLSRNDIERAQVTVVWKSFFIFCFWCLCFWKHTYGEGSWLWTWFMIHARYWWAAVAMHEAGHFANYPWFNYLASRLSHLMGIGGSPRWIYKHLRHHAQPNHCNDPELNLLSIVRLTRRQALWYLHRWQHYYITLLYSLFYLDVIQEHLRMQPPRVKGIPIPVTRKDRWFNTLQIPCYLWLLCGWSRYVTGSWYQFGLQMALEPFISLWIVLIFQVSHTTIRTLHTVGTVMTYKDWFHRINSSTIDFALDNFLWLWFYGGLNYQWEHHLVPTIPHPLFPRVARVLRRFCREKGLPPAYTYSDFSAAIKEHFLFLKTIGTGKH